MNRNFGSIFAVLFQGRWRWVGIVLILLYAGYYYISHQETVPLTGRKQVVELNREEESALGLQSYREILSKSRVLNGGPEVELVRSIGSRLARVAEDPGFQWEYNVIASDQANAFALPGGKVAVYTGILPVAGGENGLAVIMGHEIAHAIARHGAERMAHQKLTELGGLAVNMSVSEMEPGQRRLVLGALGAGAQYGILLPFSRDHESEADYMGLIYVARACFDPREAPRLWERMGRQAGGAAPSEFMSTHPAHETRVRQFNEWMPEALEVYAKSCGGKTLL